MIIVRRLSFSIAFVCLLLMATACESDGRDDGSSGSNVGGARLTGVTPTAQELQFAQDLFVALNNWRAASPRNLPALTYSPSVAGVAHDHCADMDMRDYFDHVTPENLGPGDRLDAASVVWHGYAENIAMGQPTVAAVMTAWENSAGHNQNMQTNLTQVGIGVRYRQFGGSTQIVWCQLFRNP